MVRFWCFNEHFCFQIFTVTCLIDAFIIIVVCFIEFLYFVWTDTGIIDGFSSSLINFGEYLLGIGRSDVWGLKIEAYAQGEGKVESLAKFELRCAYPVEYKAYFIDREHNLLGMAVMDYEIKEPYYMLLQFDGEQFYRIQKLPMERFADARAAMIDGWLYVLYDDQLIVQQVLYFDENR